MTKLQALVLGDWHTDSYRLKGPNTKVTGVPAGAKFVVNFLRAANQHGFTGIETNGWLANAPTVEARNWDLCKIKCKDDSDAYRIPGDQITGNLDEGSSGKPVSPPVYSDNPVADPDLLIIHDSTNGEAWCKDSGHGPTHNVLSALCKQIVAKCSAGNGEENAPRIWFMPKSLPSVILKPHSAPDFADPLWSILGSDQQLADSTCIIMSANDIRRGNSAVSFRLSWEQSIEDLMTDLHAFPQMQLLNRFAHLVFRFGHSGALYLKQEKGHRSGRFIFAPTAKHSIFRDPVDEGRVIGKSTIILASLIEAVAKCDCKMKNVKFDDALRLGLHATMEVFKTGFLKPVSHMSQISENFLKTGCQNLIRGGNKSDVDPSETFHATTLPIRVAQFPAGRLTDALSNWEILREQLNVGEAEPRREVDGLSRINLALAIVRYGHQFVLNRDFEKYQDKTPVATVKSVDDILTNVSCILKQPSCVVAAEEVGDHITLSPGRKPLFPYPGMTLLSRQHDARKLVVPIGQFNKLFVVERAEIESFRSIRNLLKRHCDDYWQKRIPTQDAKPISVAVFGSPGSGKSFAVDQIANSINSKDNRHKICVGRINLSQISSMKSLYSRLGGILDEFKHMQPNTRGSVKMGSIPLIFVDEFDANYQEVQLGWIKSFLGPMQDGKMNIGGDERHFGPTIFVFAGGVSSKFCEFDPSAQADLQDDKVDANDLRRSIDAFRKAKGTDFVSRLRGHIDIKSVSNSPGMAKPMIRRALILRGIAEKDQRLAVKTAVRAIGLDGGSEVVKECQIHEDIVYALLTADRFRHGARSIEAILQMCNPFDSVIRHASLPSRAQLSMHVDADEFMTRVHRSRFRRCASDSKAILKSRPATNGSRDKPLRNKAGNHQEVAKDAKRASARKKRVAQKPKSKARAGATPRANTNRSS